MSPCPAICREEVPEYQANEPPESLRDVFETVRRVFPGAELRSVRRLPPRRLHLVAESSAPALRSCKRKE